MTIAASALDLAAASVEASAGSARFGGVVSVDTLNARNVVAERMTPAAGNVW